MGVGGVGEDGFWSVWCCRRNDGVVLVAFTMRQVRIFPEAVGRAAKRSLEGCRNATLSLSMGSDPMGA